MRRQACIGRARRRVVELDSYRARKAKRQLRTTASRGAIRLSLAAATREAAAKTPEQVNLETAATWAARAVARRAEAERARPGSAEACDAWRAYDDARHEALEHAALAGDGGASVAAVEAAIEECFPKTRRARGRRR